MRSLCTTYQPRMMNIDRDEIIKASESMNREAVQKIIDFLNTPDIISHDQGTEEQATGLAREVNNEGWASMSNLSAKACLTGKIGRKPKS
jgi:hypothetical protein